MDIGIGLPNAVPGVDRAGTVDWARRAEEAGFASLGTIDRITYPNYESLISLAAAAAVTERIRLVTDILIAPLRPNTAALAKQVATLDSLSNGRVELGLAVGGREDDFEAMGVDFDNRGRIFEQQLQDMKRLWAADSPVGPDTAQDGGPPILIGGYTDIAFRRAAKYGDGWTQGGGTPDALKEGKAALEEVWKAEGRDGSPKVMALFYFGLGEGAKEIAAAELKHYYAWLGEETAQMIADSAATDAETLKGYVAAFEGAGADEVIIFPTNPDPDQVEMLAEAVL
jgi:alkanesulfonate monooxygenase SsuD/methylene tetrahydromethanopterin reductase-like flavin-dependent oxidoreductase (luciferase family)